MITQFELKQLEQLREHLNERHVERTAPAVKSASPFQQSQDLTGGLLMRDVRFCSIVKVSPEVLSATR